MSYNAVYERLVDGSSNTVQGYIAYGLYKSAKREWIREFETSHLRKPRPAEVQAYVDGYTQQMRDVFEAQAAGVLANFAESAVTDATHAIVEEALKGGFWRSGTQSIAANAIYTLVLVAIVIILKRAGIDLLSLAG